MIHKLFTYCNVVLQTYVCDAVAHSAYQPPMTNRRVNYFSTAFWLCTKLKIWHTIKKIKKIHTPILTIPPQKEPVLVGFISCLGVRIQWFRICTSLYVKCGAATVCRSCWRSDSNRCGSELDWGCHCWRRSGHHDSPCCR